MEEERRKLYQEIFRQFFMQSDAFLIHKWSSHGSLPEPFSEEDRKEAYHNFYQRVKRDKICNRQTIRKWFGLDGYSIPGREHIFRIAFSVGLSSKEAEEYLRYGISEPGFQISDYTECIAMYCLDNGYGADTFWDMVEFFEHYSSRTIPLEQTSHTAEMEEQYVELKHVPKEEFLRWMCDNCALFKGYSMTTYRRFLALIDEALVFFRRDVRESLFRELEQTDFFSWADRQNIPEEQYGQAIRRYIKNAERRRDSVLSAEKWRDIKRLLVAAYSPKNRVSDLLTELYSALDDGMRSVNKEMWRLIHREIGTVDAKYVSELLGVALHKKKHMELNRALTELNRMTDDEPCPSWILALLPKKKTEEMNRHIPNVKEAGKLLKKSRTVQGQRVRTVRRSDLLILLQYISQKKYLDRLSGSDETYSGIDAREEFVTSANTVLESCGMRPVDSRYRLDHTLLSCFDEDDVFLFAEIFEE